MTLECVSSNIFQWSQSNQNLEIKKNLNFNDFSCQALFGIFQTLTKYARLKQMPIAFPYLKHLQSIEPSFVAITRPLSNKINGLINGNKWTDRFLKILFS